MVDGLYGEHHLYRSLGFYLIVMHKRSNRRNVSNPNLLHSMKNLTKEQFGRVLIDGRGIMYSFSGNKMVVDGIDDLYVYLKGRSDEASPAGDLTEMK